MTMTKEMPAWKQNKTFLIILIFFCFFDTIKSGFGVIALDHFVAGGRNFYATKPITKLSDMKGMKIRVQSAPLYIDTVTAFGASATPLDNSEVYSALQTGVIDGATQSRDT